MININLVDSYNVSCTLNDVIMMHFKNSRIKYIGVLKFDTNDYTLKLFFNRTDWIALNEPGCTAFEKLCGTTENNAIKNMFGKIKIGLGKAGEKQLAKIYAAAFDTNHELKA